METPRKKRKAFSIRDKLGALDRIKSGVTQTQVARDLGIFFIIFFHLQNRVRHKPDSVMSNSKAFTKNREFKHYMRMSRNCDHRPPFL